MILAAKKKQLEIHNKLLFPSIPINKENSHLGAPQPKVKIADLSHNLMAFESNVVPGGADSNGNLRI